MSIHKGWIQNCIIPYYKVGKKKKNVLSEFTVFNSRQKYKNKKSRQKYPEDLLLPASFWCEHLIDTWTENLFEATQLTLVAHDNYNMTDVVHPDFIHLQTI